MEATQIIIAAAIAVLTVVLALVGIQVVRILMEFKKTVEKMNKILDDAGKMSESIAGPASSFSGVLFGVKTGLKVLSTLLKRHKKGDKK